MKKIILPLILCLIPLVYALYLYRGLPDIIPIHFDANGLANDFGSKNYIFLGAGLPWFIWLLYFAIRKFDPKNRLKEMGSKFDNFLILNVLITSLLGCFIIYSMMNTGFKLNTKIMFLILGSGFILLGNYMPSFKPNYFIGIRTPWTLESEEVWRKTHKLGGIVWIICGLFIFSFALFIDNNKELKFLLLTPTIIIASLIPMIYSYWYFQKLKKKESSENKTSN